MLKIKPLMTLAVSFLMLQQSVAHLSHATPVLPENATLLL
jgi:hypothetical protein